MALNPRQHQGQFGEAFVRVLAAAAGLIATRPELDVTGTDLLIGYKGRQGRLRHPLVEVQVKSWVESRAHRVDGYWKYRMRVANFNDVAGRFALPRFLALVIVPDDWQRYAVCGDQLLELRHSAYWLSLEDRDPLDPGSQATVAVDVPDANALTPASLLSLVSGQYGKVGS